MATLKADRRLYETADRDALVEEGDPRGRWLLAGLTRTIGESDVKKYDLTSEDGRVVYPGCPTAFGELAPQVKEARDHADKMIRADRDKAAAAEAKEAEPDPVMRIGHSSAVRDDGSGAADDSDRNEDELPEWAPKTAPAAYLEKYPTGKHVELAQRYVDAAQADGGSGDS